MKETINSKILELQEEAKKLMEERQLLVQRDNEIEMRMQQIQGSLNTLVDMKKEFIDPEVEKTDS